MKEVVIAISPYVSERFMAGTTGLEPATSAVTDDLLLVTY
jgi:hypothetical protein